MSIKSTWISNDGELLSFFAAEILRQKFCYETEMCLIFPISTDQKTDPIRPATGAGSPDRLPSLHHNCMLRRLRIKNLLIV